MAIVKLTSKRQATLPKSLCEEMQVQPGDSLAVDRVELQGAQAWVLRPVRMENLPWVGALRSYAEGKNHDYDAIRRSIEEGRRHG